MNLRGSMILSENRWPTFRDHAPASHRFIASFTIVTVVLASLMAQAATRPKKAEQAPAPTPGDKRDRIVAAPGTPFHGRAYWQAAAQCGGIYFKLNSVYSDAAITAKVIKPDPAAYTRFTKEAEAASIAATRFFEASEHFLVADRKLGRDDAVLTYDPVANSAGERLKSIDAAVQAAKPCAEFYNTCRGAHPQMCSETTALTN
jgi:hypothetical protein